MSSITIRNLGPTIKERLRVRAAERGHSMEAEARRILADAVGTDGNREVSLAEVIRRRFAPFGGVDELEVHPRVAVGEAPVLDR